ncbi:MAG: SUF system NifU family Fe-S cluster assembly protein [Deltaproteobacteria bacterium]|nr:MAG: SUF system NifU family Fe-S cluster assembly protein [Deltaproteobacteria bacterium]
MSQNLQDLYRKVVLEHNRNPRNFGALENFTHHAKGNNPLCGDCVELFLQVEGNEVQQVGFEGEGCAICNASSSLLTEAIQGQSLQQVHSLHQRFEQMLAGEFSAQDEQELGPLLVFTGLADFPARLKCATLAWRTLQAALENSEAPVSTES